MSDLDKFELFAHVAETGSITRAAEELGISKASLSKQLRGLEAAYEIELFTRHKQRLQITPQGELLLAQCKRLSRELEAARGICRQFHDEPKGKLHVVAFTYFANQLIFPKLKDFLKRYPKLEMRIDTTERIPDFIQEQVDIAVGFSLPVPHPSDVIQRRMATTHYILCASAQYFKEFGIPTTLEDLHNHRYIAHVSRSIKQIIKLKPAYKISLKPYLLINDVVAMIACAKQHLGLIQLPYYMLEDSIKSGELVSVLPEYQATDVGVYYHFLKLHYTQPKIRKFIDYFLLG